MEWYRIIIALVLLLAIGMVGTVHAIGDGGTGHPTPGDESGGGGISEDEPEPLDEICDITDPPFPPDNPIICGGDAPEALENDAAVRAYHTDGTLVTNVDPLMLNEDVDCIAGIDWAAVPLPGNEVEMVCYILPPGSDPSQYEMYALAKLSSTEPVECPPELSSMDQCFSVRWDGVHIDEVGEWYFVAVFFLNNDPVALAGDDFRVYPFMVVPEFMVGGVASIVSMLAVLAYRRYRTGREEE
ncbi:MAG: hypothetical protein RMJ59_07710 [Candidatus Nitrosocaldus sp.]|nr:hypothetical protein [Candidatus Nitrosocaldus sp.]